MSIIEAIILGIIQGATEFLPVSSSGHSILVPAVFGLSQPDLNAVVIAHLGTLLAVLIYFWKDLWSIVVGAIQGLIQGKPLATTESRLAWFIVIGTIPAAVAGILLEDWFEAVFGNPRWAAVFLLGTAVFLVLGERLLSGEKELSGMTWLDSIIIGLFQMLALLPGISRSGSTIVGGLSRGLNRELAARYSFLLSVPVILGAGVLKLSDLFGAPDLAAQIPVLAATFITSAIVGYGCILFLISWLKERSLYPFAIYTASFGLIYLILSFVGVFP